jgi:FtsZ-binding cell division protein ZapB
MASPSDLTRRIREQDEEIERLREQNDALTLEIEQARTGPFDNLDARFREGVQHADAVWQDEVERLREENASLVDRHNRESHGTASHEAMAYDALKAENERLRAGWRVERKVMESEAAAAKKAETEVERLRARAQELEQGMARVDTAAVLALKAENERLQAALEEIAAASEGLEEFTAQQMAMRGTSVVGLIGRMRDIARQALEGK